ncbi:MAG: hypothetical protein K0Q50_49 [Vampirovibrio sp.]|nr:hypothetical protein [Vampirovibrio sp.]
MFHTVHHSPPVQTIPKLDGGSKPTGASSELPHYNGPFNPSLDLLQTKLASAREKQAQQIKDEFKRTVHAAAEAAKKAKS